MKLRFPHITLFIMTLFFLCPRSAQAQDLSLNTISNYTRFNLDLNRVWDYNQYEKSRWGIGLNYLSAFKKDRTKNFYECRKLYTEAYVAWGYGDHAWKYGALAMTQHPRGVFSEWMISYAHDIERVGRHQVHELSLLGISNNTGYCSNHYSAYDRIEAGTEFLKLTILGRFSKEHYLFDTKGLLFPSINDEDKINPYYAPQRYNELYLKYNSRKTWTLHVLTGNRTMNDSTNVYFQTYLDYNKKKYYQNGGKLYLWGQAGIATGKTPLSRQFDLGGTGFNFVYFNHTFLTVLPNQFMSNAYAEASIKYVSPMWWNYKYSKPRLLVQLNAMAGTQIRGLETMETSTVDGYKVTAPSKGLVEPLVGVDKLLRWGTIDIGFAAAYQITPGSASYHLNNFMDGLALVGCATLILDE